MRHATLQAKPTRWSSARIQQEAASKAHGISLTPPTYGMDYVDRASAEVGRVRPAGAMNVHPTPSTLIPPTRTPEQVHAPNAQEAEPDARQVESPPDTLSSQPLQRQEAQDDEERLQHLPSTTGLPEPLKAGIETLSGMPVDDVTVHYNSSNPAQVQALAYTHGAEIYVGPGAARYLPHEAWHIVQQRQGRVPPISQVNGVAINDDAGLEQEADVMGSKALRMTRAEPVAMRSAHRGATSLQRVGKTHGAQVRAGEAIRASREQGRWHVLPTRASAPVIQRAGHPEDLCFLSGARWIVKRADATETRQYQRFQDPWERRPPSIPIFFGPYYDVDSLRSQLDSLGQEIDEKQLAKIHTMAEAVSPDGKSLIIMSSAKRGNAGADLKDLKLGKYTASGTDQTRRGTSTLGKKTKTAQHDWMDLVSGSRERGFRDEDAWQKAEASDKVFNPGSVASANVVPLTTMLANSPPAALDAIKRDLSNIKLWLQRTDTVYVGMSVLVVSNRDYPRESNATTIDFEHPIFQTDASFETHRQGMLDGVDKILEFVERALQSLPPQPLPRSNPVTIPEQPIQVPGKRSEPIPIRGRERQDIEVSKPLGGSPDAEESALLFSLEF